MQLPEKYKVKFDVPSLETSNFSLYFAGIVGSCNPTNESLFILNIYVLSELVLKTFSANYGENGLKTACGSVFDFNTLISENMLSSFYLCQKMFT